jgi:ribosomal protein L23
MTLAQRLRFMLPNIPMILLHRSSKHAGNTLVFRTRPNVTKLEIKSYFEQIYGTKVLKVNTLNVDGLKKRARNPGYYKQAANFKKAYVTFESSAVAEIAPHLPTKIR